MEIGIGVAESDVQLESAAAVLLELRPAYGKAELLERVREQMRHGYQIACGESEGEILCVAGFVIARKLAWGRHMYVDDLITAEAHRGKGAGTAMMRWLKAHARQTGCEQLHLDSGVSRFGAHRFYLREGFAISSHHFAMTL
ncbi:GNAT family N-acetyltransferase [Algiphilus aromaticivorans]|uniref:GNAT family N-acetyltransferase n=1 Tax=Algiphilus aromaticivorans TaxID=382454 RepID=UPI0018DCB094|nr:GNAT family N-acetyltransferase [Algiphilus aromaticivorans]